MSLTSVRICLLGAFVGAAFVTLGLLTGQAPASALENDLLPDPAASSISSVAAEVSATVTVATDAALPPVKQLADAALAPAPPAAPAPAPAPAHEAVAQPAAPLPAAIADVAAPVARPVQNVLDAGLPALQEALAPAVAPVADAALQVVDQGAKQVGELPLPLGLGQAVMPVDPGSALDLLDPVVAGPLPGVLPLSPPTDGTPSDRAPGPVAITSLKAALDGVLPPTGAGAAATRGEASGVVDAWSAEAGAPAASAVGPTWPLQPGDPPPGSPNDALPGSGTSAAPGSGVAAASAALLPGSPIPAPGYGRALLSLAATSWCGGVDLEPGSTPD